MTNLKRKYPVTTYSKIVLLVFIALSLFSSLSYGQREQHTWYAGRNGIFVDFNSGTPVVTCTNNLVASEGSGMYCDPNTGNLLIYTNGQTVNNGSHNTLTNGTGLLGNSSATETALVIPKSCGNLDEYFVLTNNLNRVYWSEVDLSVGPNGTVNAATKNTLLQTNTGERLGCAPHGNGKAGWILLTGAGGVLNAYYVDATGINTTPVVSNTALFNSSGSERGCIIISEDYTKLVIAIEYQGVYYCDFDINTGLASNFQKIPPSTNGFSACFSPDGTKIYWTNGYANNLSQYDILTGTNTFLDNNVSGVKLGPDGVVYSGTYGVSFWGTITSPNTAGTACNYTRNGLSLNGCSGAWNFPNQSINTTRIEMTTSNDTIICGGQPVTLFANPPTLTYTWNQGLGVGATHVVSPAVTTVYQVTGTDTAGCTLIDSVTVTIGDTTPPTPVCKDTSIYLDATGNFTIDSSFIENGSSDNCGISTITLSQYNFNCSQIGANTITMYVKDVSNNVDSCTAIVTVYDTIAPTAICKDTAIYLDNTGAYNIDSSYINNNSTDNCGIAAISVTPSSFNCSNIGTNTVTLTVTDISGNSSTCTANVIVIDTLPPTANCKDTTIYLTSGGTFTIDSSFINNSSTDNCGIQTITLNRYSFNCNDTGINPVTMYVTDFNGNIDSCNANVIVRDTNTIFAYAGLDDSICQATNYTMSATPPAASATGTWSVLSGPNTPTVSNANSATATLSGLISGSYQLEWQVTNGSGCNVSFDTVIITVFDAPLVNAGNDTSLCGVYSLNLNGNATTGNGQWTYISPAPSVPSFSNANLNNTSVSNLIEGTYSFVWTIVNGNCPPVSDTVNITVYDAPNANAGPNLNLCNQFSTVLVANALTGSATGQWSAYSGPNIPSFSSPTSSVTNITGLSEGTYRILWTVNNGTCQPDVDTVVINVYNQPLANAGVDTNLCGVYSLTLYGNQPIGSASGRWIVDPGYTPPSTPIFGDSSIYNTSLTNLIEGRYRLLWILSNGNCTPSIDTVIIDVWDEPIANAGPDTNLCATYAYQFSATPLTGLAQGYWRLDPSAPNPNTPNIINAGLPNGSVNNLIEGTYRFVWEVTNGPCYRYYDTITINVYDQPTAIVGPDQDLCFETSTLINAVPLTGSATGQWVLSFSSPNTPTFNSNSASTTVGNMQEGGYYVFHYEATNGTCPVSRDSLIINNHAIPIAQFTQDTTVVCAGDCIQFTDESTIDPSSQITNYYWNIGGKTSNTQNPYICWQNPGSYSAQLIVETNHGCRDTINKPDLITVNTRPLADFNVYLVDDPDISTKIQIQDNSRYATTYFYDLGDGNTTTIQNPEHIYNDSGFYDIMQVVANNDGCTDTLIRTIFVHILIVYVPNAFTPNGDGFNEVFLPMVSGDDPNAYLFQVFNRWGQLIYQNQLKGFGWDGTFKGKPCKTDTYVWKLKTKYKDGEREKEYTGHVNLMR